MSATPSKQQIQFYDLQSKNSKPWSPYTLKTRLALNFKGLGFNENLVSYPDIEANHIATGVTNESAALWKYICPAIKDGNVAIQNSEVIANYLEKTYPDKPLFPFPGSRALYAVVNNFFGREWEPLCKYLIVPRVPANLDEKAMPYFVSDREAKVGTSLAELVSDEERVKYVDDLVAKARIIGSWLEVEPGPFLAGEQAQYADLVIVAWVHLIVAISPQDAEKVLAAVSPLERLYQEISSQYL